MKQLKERERGSNEETEIELEIGTEKKSERKRKNASKRIEENDRREIEEGGNLSKRIQSCKLKRNYPQNK